MRSTYQRVTVAESDQQLGGTIDGVYAANQNEAAVKIGRSSKACLNIRSEGHYIRGLPLSRQSVHRGAEAAQLKCVLVARVNAYGRVCLTTSFEPALK